MEAPSGFEPEMEVLQTSALPLGDGAVRLCRGIMLPAGRERGERRWSGKRDSNPRLRPWQGRTLPLSYSRSRRLPIVPQRFAASQIARRHGRTGGSRLSASRYRRGTYAVNACGYTSMRGRPSSKSTVTTSKRQDWSSRRRRARKSSAIRTIRCCFHGVTAATLPP